MKRLIALALAAPVLGVLGAKLWLWWWSPPTGIAYHHQFQQNALGLQHDFDGTGWYVAVVLGLGAVLGLAACFAARGLEVLTVGVALGTSLLMAFLVREIGLAWGPGSPNARAATLPDLTAMHAGLTVDQHVTLLLLAPLATAVVAAVGMLGVGGRNVISGPPARESEAG